MEASPATETEIPAPTKRRVSRQSINIAALIIVIAVVVLISSIWYVLPLGPHLPGVPQIITKRDSTSTAYTWTVIWGGGAGYIPKSDVYVQLRNSSGIYTIQTFNLTFASGTHGFNYVPASSGDYIIAGDVFSLSKDYASGSKIFLVDLELYGQYAVLTV